jgi:nitrate/TMAO reductase-like tetraheme cytochrome c subunit
MGQDEADNGSSRWSRLWRRPHRKWLLGIPIGGFLAVGLGAVALGTLNFVLHETSTTEFCFGCHSHEQSIRPEYEASSHFSNQAGVQADCADCHMPHGWFRYTWKKMVVSLDIVPELMGKLDTKEKFESHRGEMAKSVWAQYRDNDSEFCRHCHNPERMDLDKQDRRAGRSHAKAVTSGETCIDCHQGIVHALPDGWTDLWIEVEQATNGDR